MTAILSHIKLYNSVTSIPGFAFGRGRGSGSGSCSMRKTFPRSEFKGEMKATAIQRI